MDTPILHPLLLSPLYSLLEKEWLNGAKLEEDPKTGPTNVGAGKEWEVLV
jgi:hypothetical protein